MIKATLLSVLALSTTALAVPTDTLFKRKDYSCEIDGAYQPVANVIACAEHLRTWGGGVQACGLQDRYVWCEIDGTAITGTNYYGDQYNKVTSCADIADSIIRVVDGCTTPDGYVGGRVHSGAMWDILITVGPA